MSMNDTMKVGFKSLVASISALLCITLFAGCSDSSTLTEKEAEKLIKNGKSYLEKKSVYYMPQDKNSPLIKEIESLIASGKVDLKAGKNQWAKTEDVKELYEEIAIGLWGRGNLYAYPYFIEKDIKTINEILVDPQGIARVSYAVEFRPTEYYRQLEAKDPAYYRNVKDEFGLTVSEHIKRYQEKHAKSQEVAILKKWDKGWRLLNNK